MFIKLVESVVKGQETTFIEIDTTSEEERYAVQYGLSGIAFNSTDAGKRAAIEEYLTNVKHQLESAKAAGLFDQ